MSDRILVGTRKGTFLIDKAGSRWQPHLAGHAGQGVNFVARDPHNNTLWAALGHGHWGAKLSHSTDGGATWTRLRKGLPQEHAYDVIDRHALDQRGGRLAFGTTTGNLYASEDRGDSWQTVANNLPPIYSVRFG